MARWLLALAALLLAPAALARAPATLDLVDLTAAFAEFEAASRTMGDAQRVAAFKAHFAPLLPGFYSNERVRSPHYDSRILEALQRFGQDGDAIASVSRRFTGLLAPAQRSFEAEFGPMTGFPPVILLHSLGEMDGGTRTLPGGSRLIFGADMIARLHGEHDVQPFFHHELFHLLHSRSFEECEAVWCNLWSEGLATLASHRLNPEASDSELLLTIPEPLRAAVENDRDGALCAVLQRLDSEEETVTRALFSFGDRLLPTLPPRAGYYIGYLAASEAARTRSLRELAALDRASVRPIVEASLEALADCDG